MDTLVFDIETQNFFTDPGVGRDNFDALKISVVGVYSYKREAYGMFGEDEMPELAEWFAAAGRIVGFSINRYDVPVLNQYFRRLKIIPATGAPAPDLWLKERIDLLEEVELASGRRISLSRLAECNLGIKKERHGSEAIALYREGRMDELKAYCRNDVELTKALYEIWRERHYFLLPDAATGGTVKVEFAKQA